MPSPGTSKKITEKTYFWGWFPVEIAAMLMYFVQVLIIGVFDVKEHLINFLTKRHVSINDAETWMMLLTICFAMLPLALLCQNRHVMIPYIVCLYSVLFLTAIDYLLFADRMLFFSGRHLSFSRVALILYNLYGFCGFCYVQHLVTSRYYRYLKAVQKSEVRSLLYEPRITSSASQTDLKSASSV